MREKSDASWEVLAVTRFVLAMVVMVGHLNERPGLTTWWTPIGLFFNQGSAVYGFLLISGYAIAASLERKERGFYWRRVRRIYPTYLASVALAGIAVAIGAAATEPAARWVALLLMVQSFAAPTLAADGQLWTLAVEWWNYILAPVYRRVLDVGLIILCCMSLWFYCRLGAPEHPAPTTHGLMFALLTWFWIAGFLYRRRRGTLYGYALLFGPLMVAFLFAWIGLAVWIGAVALAICEHVRVSGKFKAAFIWLGDLSYPVYAVHIPMFSICLALGIKGAFPAALTVLATSAVVLHAIDLPVRNWRPARPRPDLATANSL
ncbi:MAG TPA: acyltransferase [Caulobacteraceae bacterium]